MSRPRHEGHMLQHGAVRSFGVYGSGRIERWPMPLRNSPAGLIDVAAQRPLVACFFPGVTVDEVREKLLCERCVNLSFFLRHQCGPALVARVGRTRRILR